MKVVTAAQMRALDGRTIHEIGIPGVVLMENAGRGAAAHLVQACPGARAGRVVVLAGRGNNGGDGLVIARILHGWGARVQVVLLAEVGMVTGDARTNLDAAIRSGVPVTEWPDRQRFVDEMRLLGHADAIVDALLGTGLSKNVEGAYADAIARINEARGFVLAVDLPSGLSADTGRPLGDAVRADLTVTFGLPKLAHVTYPGLAYCGEVRVVEIGIPPNVVQEADLPYEVIEPRDVLVWLGGRRARDAHKGHFGHLLILAGSAGMTGAAVLTARAASRVGAGLVTAGIPRGIAPSVEARLLDAMTRPLPETAAGAFSERAVRGAREALSGKTALALGPGIGTGEPTRRFVLSVLAGADVPAVVDADGLNCLGTRHALLRRRKAPTVLTPHPGEAARLLGVSTAQVQADRFGAVTTLARKTGAVVALKGARTLVAAPDGRVAVNPTGNPGLASGGSGDVLTGMVGGLLAQGLGPFEAARAAVYIHGLAADRAARITGERALVAGDVLDALPSLLAEIEAGRLAEADG